MTSIALGRTDVIVGVDTHKDEHVAVAIDGLGGVIDQPRLVTANPAGYAELLDWAHSLGTVHAFGVEGCGSYGSGLARFLRREDQTVREVARPPRSGERRMSGKSDVIDAEHAARTVLSGQGTATPKLADGQVEAIRVIKIARDTAVKAHSTTMITLKAVVVTAPDDLREVLESLTDHQLILTCAALDTDGDIGDPEVAVRHSGFTCTPLPGPPRRDQDPQPPPQRTHENRRSPNAGTIRCRVRHLRRDAHRCR